MSDDPLLYRGTLVNKFPYPVTCKVPKTPDERMAGCLMMLTWSLREKLT